MANVKDPVCGMEVNEATTPDKSDYKGKTYYFCCSDCKELFDKEPEKYVKPEKKRGCCGH